MVWCSSLFYLNNLDPRCWSSRRRDLTDETNRQMTSIVRLDPTTDRFWFRSAEDVAWCSTTTKQYVVVCTENPARISNVEENSLARIDAVWWIATIRLPGRCGIVSAIEDLDIGSISIRMIDTTRGYNTNNMITLWPTRKVSVHIEYLEYWRVSDWRGQCLGVMLFLRKDKEFIVNQPARMRKQAMRYLRQVVEWWDWVVHSQQRSWHNVVDRWDLADR